MSGSPSLLSSSRKETVQSLLNWNGQISKKGINRPMFCPSSLYISAGQAQLLEKVLPKKSDFCVICWLQFSICLSSYLSRSFLPLSTWQNVKISTVGKGEKENISCMLIKMSTFSRKQTHFSFSIEKKWQFYQLYGKLGRQWNKLIS